MWQVVEKYTVTRLANKLPQIQVPFIVLTTIIFVIGCVTLYSAKGTLEPWAFSQILRWTVFIPIMLLLAVIGIDVLFRYAYALHFLSLVLLILVALVGTTKLGAQRWLSIGGFHLQPAEMAKITIILALGRFFQQQNIYALHKWFPLFMSLLLASVHFVLIIKQPDLGTALLYLMVTFLIIVVVGISWRNLFILGLLIMASLPAYWFLFLRDYQKERITTFFSLKGGDDFVLTSGYHALQSKIALGSGGLFGKGFLNATQGNLHFIPEKHTDFIFTLFAEQFGFLGSLAVIICYFLVCIYGVYIALSAASTFGRILAFGASFNFALHSLVNMGMVMGLLPVTGTPLPLMSYGGTSLFTHYLAFGLILNVWVHRFQIPGNK